MTAVVRRALAMAALAVATPAAAHGLLMTAAAEGQAVTGKVYYSDGTVGAGESVELRDLSATGSEPLWASTDAQGAFRFPAEPGHRYAVVAHGEEGHTTEMQLTLATGERARLVDQPDDAAGDALPPAWAVIGGLLLLSAVVALGLRLRGRPRA